MEPSNQEIELWLFQDLHKRCVAQQVPSDYIALNPMEAFLEQSDTKAHFSAQGSMLEFHVEGHGT